MIQDKYWKYLFGASLIALLGSAVLRLLNPLNNDFEAFFEASNHFLGGSSFYHPDVERPFKYPPVTIFLFAPLSLLEGSVARVLFLLIDILATLTNIFLTAYLFFGNTSFWTNPKLRTRFYQANTIGIFVALRFLDNEYHSKNLNQMMFAFILLGLIFILHRGRSFLGTLVLGFGSLLKLTPLLALWCFLKAPFGRQTLLMALAFALLLVLPSPGLWLEWLEQMRATTGEFSVASYNFFQGFFALSYLLTGQAERGIWAVLLALPFLFVGLWSSLRLAPEAISLQPLPRRQRWVVSFASLVLFSMTLNPLAWHHLYGFLVIFLPLLVYWKEGRLNRWILGACLALSLSARGIAGSWVSDAFEASQGIFIGVLVLLVSTWKELRTSLKSEN